MTYPDVVRTLNNLPADDWLREDVDEFVKTHPREEFPKEILCEGYKRVLRQNVCMFRGYVLDGFPRSYSEARALFYSTEVVRYAVAIPRKPKKKKPEVKKEHVEGDNSEEKEPEPEPEPEPEDEEKKKPKFEKDIYPHSFIMLSCDEELVMQRYARTSQKLSPAKLQKELELYNMLNMVDACSLEENGQTVWNFFQEKKDEVLVSEVKMSTDSAEAYEAVRIYVERNGRPYNFLESDVRVHNARQQGLELKEEGKRKEVAQKTHVDEEEQARAKKDRENKNKARWKEISEHVETVKEAQQISTRAYLMDYIVPVLNKGMINVSTIMPADPVDYLAEYLLKSSAQS